MSTFRYLSGLWRKRAAGQVIIQVTDRCNARCPQCGMRATNRFERRSLATDDIKRTIDAAGAKGVPALSFTGGEPLLMLDELAPLIRRAGEAGITYIRTGTNGFFFRDPDEPDFEDRVKSVADTLADTPLRNFWISVDSTVPGLHEEMRGFPGLIEGIRKGLPIFHERGIYPTANLGMNRNAGQETVELKRADFATEEAYLDAFSAAYESATGAFYQFVADLGFTMASTCYPMSVEAEDDQDLSAVYAATSTDDIVRYSAPEKARLFKALLDTVPKHRSRIRIFSPLTSLYALHKQYAEGTPEQHAYGCRGGIDYFFIDSRDGNVYPCGYRGNENMGKYWELEENQLDPEPWCYQCDWECFRDPSELFGPLIDAVSKPLTLLSKFRRDPQHFRLWRQDLSYYRACDFFDGRKPPRLADLHAA